MLQQTTVAAVRGRYEAFLERFPDLAALARASRPQVLAAWSGLGYYARARHLHAAARRIARDGGRFPRDPAGLLPLPGFGSYMAAVVASLAFGARVPAADANVTRVLSRIFAIPGTAGTREHARAVLDRAASLLPARRPGDTTAALMDLGQLVCRSRRPDCPACPLADLCAARALGRPERYPHRPDRKPAVGVFCAVAVARRGRRTLVLRSGNGLLGGMWTFPSGEAATPARARRRLRAVLDALGLRAGAAVGEARHTIMNRRMEIVVHAAQADAARLRRSGRAPAGVRWVTPAELERGPVPTLTRKIARAAGILERDESRDADPSASRSSGRRRARSGDHALEGRDRL